MSQITLTISPEEKKALERAARVEYRRYKEHARYLLIKALEEQGYIEPRPVPCVPALVAAGKGAEGG